eukprot:Seg910.6 transcript_id=Seg910.6/GoldUCD/mRNA.D3Y31 product="Trace amine-associated receptor 1" protein_id=Seg910.6/GoldUCD/D3Y31
MDAGSLTHCTGKFCYVLATINILFAALTIPENVIVLIALGRLAKGRMWKVPNVLMAALATTDFLSGCISQSLYGYFLLKQGGTFKNEHVQGVDSWLLLVLNYSSYTLCGASLLIVAIMSIDRLLAIARPMTYKANMYRNRILVALAFASIFCAFIPILRFTSNKTVSVFVLIISGVIVISLLATFISYIAVICMFYRLGRRSSLAISRSRFSLAQHDIDPKRGSIAIPESSSTCRERRLTKSFAMIAVTLVAMYLPQLIIKPFTLNESGGLRQLPVSIEDIANTLLYCNSFANPLIYAFRHKGIRKEIKLMFRSFFKRKSEAGKALSVREKKSNSLETCSSSGSSGPAPGERIKLDPNLTTDTNV